MALSGSSGASASSGGIMAGKAFVLLYVKNNLLAGLNQAAGEVKAFGKRVGSVGATFAKFGGAGAAVGLGAAAAALNDLAKQGAVADALGLTAEQFTGIAGLAKSVGMDVREFTESLVTMGKLGADAAAGIGEVAGPAFAKMGIDANQFIKLRADEQFFNILDAAEKMGPGLDRTRSAMVAFGEDGGKWLLPLFGKSATELRKMAAGFAVSSKDMQAATDASLAYAEAGAEVHKAWTSASVAAAPLVKAIAGGVAAAAGGLTAFVQQNREVVLGLGLTVGGLTAVGLGMMALGPAVMAVSAAWTGFTAIFSAGSAVIAAAEFAIAAPIVAIPAALAAAGVAFLAFTGEGRGHLSAFSKSVNDSFGETWQNLKSGWTIAIADIGRGDFKGAFSVAFASLKLEWVKLTVGFEKAWEESVGNMIRVFERFRRVVNAALDKPAAPLDGAAPGKKAAGPLDRRWWLPAFAGAMDHINRKVFGDAKVDKQKAEQWKLDDALEGLAQDIGRIANEGKDERDAKWKKTEQDAKNAADAAKLGGLMRGGLGWLRGGGDSVWGEMKRLLIPPADLQGSIANIQSRGAWGADASRLVFGGWSGPIEQMNQNLGGKLDKVVEAVKGIKPARGEDLVWAGGGGEF